MPEAFVVLETHLDAEQALKRLGGEQAGLRTVSEDAAFAHEDHAIDFGKNVGEMVRDHENADALLRDAAQGLAQLALGCEIECVGWLVEEQHLGTVDERAGDHDAPLLTGGHLADELCCQMLGLHEVEGFAGAVAHLRCDVQIGPQRRRGEEARDDGIETGGDRGALAGEFRGDHAEMGAQLRNIPALAPEEEQLRFRRDDWIALAGDGFDEGGFAAAIGAENGHMFTVGDAQRDVVEDDVVAACDADVPHEQEAGFARGIQFDSALGITRLLQSGKLVEWMFNDDFKLPHLF